SQVWLPADLCATRDSSFTAHIPYEFTPTDPAVMNTAQYRYNQQVQPAAPFVYVVIRHLRFEIQRP
ncbi:MAG TPA: hypothetical protein VGC99_07345, partial [Candidatus Tectomicrobia bacterium]